MVTAQPDLTTSLFVCFNVWLLPVLQGEIMNRELMTKVADMIEQDGTQIPAFRMSTYAQRLTLTINYPCDTACCIAGMTVFADDRTHYMKMLTRSIDDSLKYQARELLGLDRMQANALFELAETRIGMGRVRSHHAAAMLRWLVTADDDVASDQIAQQWGVIVLGPECPDCDNSSQFHERGYLTACVTCGGIGRLGGSPELDPKPESLNDQES